MFFIDKIHGVAFEITFVAKARISEATDLAGSSQKCFLGVLTGKRRCG